MTRAEAKSKLVALGVVEPTEEQVTQYLDTISDETKSEKARAERYKADADKLKDVQAELDGLKEGNMSEIEKANKALEDANNKIAELEKKDAVRSKRANAVSKWKLTSEQAEKVYGDDGSFDDDLLGQIISEKETAAANAKEQEIANKASNPGGGKGSGKGEELSTAEKLANKMFGGKKEETSVISHYINK